MIEMILLDVEGTTTSISFVHQTLFPFSWERMDAYIAANKENPEIQKAIGDAQRTLREENKPADTAKDVVISLKQWIRDDRKHPALKVIQGLIWQDGYDEGVLKGHVYDDVRPAFERWTKQGLKLAIYSSGSVLAQRSIFGFSTSGDLNSFITANFDTAVGAKRETTSYVNIARQLKIAPQNILFLSDIIEELSAAQAAGLRVVQIVRDGTRASTLFSTAPTLLDVSTQTDK